MRCFFFLEIISIVHCLYVAPPTIVNQKRQLHLACDFRQLIFTPPAEYRRFTIPDKIF